MKRPHRYEIQSITRSLENLREELDGITEDEREFVAENFQDEGSEDDADSISSLEFLEAAGSALDAAIEALESVADFA